MDGFLRSHLDKLLLAHASSDHRGDLGGRLRAIPSVLEGLAGALLRSHLGLGRTQLASSNATLSSCHVL